MKRKITVKAELSAVLPTGSFQNMRPSFMAQEEFEVDAPDAQMDVIESNAHDRLYALCTQQIKLAEEKARIEKVKSDLKNIRFYKKNDREYVSVTSILSYDKDFFVSDEDLKQLAAQGSLIDAEFKNLVVTGKYTQNKDLPMCAADRFIIKSGSKHLALDGWNIPGFLEKHPLKNMVVGVPVFNDDWQYAGTPDILCDYEGVTTICDVKRTKSETDNFAQMAAYAKCKGLENVKQMMIIPIKPEADGGNKQGFSKPVISTDIDRYFEIFLLKRKEFKSVYGI